jgi:hypothetical protein
MNSLGCNQRCSRHSSVDGRLLHKRTGNGSSTKNSSSQIEADARMLECCRLPWSSFEDEHQETSGFHADLLVQGFESIADVSNVLPCFVVRFSAVVSKIESNELTDLKAQAKVLSFSSEYLVWFLISRIVMASRNAQMENKSEK